MKSILLSCAAILAAAVSACAADTVAGKWQIHQSVAGNESDLSCTFTQTGEDLAGTCDGPGGAVKVTGKLTEMKIAWTVQMEYNGSPITLRYNGTVAETKMSGTLGVDPYGVEGEFTATAAK